MTYADNFERDLILSLIYRSNWDNKTVPCSVTCHCEYEYKNPVDMCIAEQLWAESMELMEG